MAQKTPLLRPLREKGATLYVFPSAQEDIGLNLNSRATGVALSHYALLNIGAFVDPDKNTKNDANIEMAEELQNYVMNFETLLLNLDNYNYQDYHTVSERVFWHWMIHRGYINIDSNTLTENGNRIVQCFGSIDAGNSLSTEFGMFNETYINIPTSYGSGPVFFKQCPSDINYLLNHTYNGTNTNLLGRDTNPSGKYLNNTKASYDEGNNYRTIGLDGIEILKDINQIQTKLGDGIIVNSYDDININLDSATDFDFNVILLYYSVYDQDDTTKSPYAINLFGIIFLDGFIKNGDVYTIPSIHKKKSTNSYFGNSYSFRVNIKTMSVYDNTDAAILDNTTLSSIYSVDFSDVISNLNRAIDVMNTNVHTTMSILDEYMKIRAYYDDLYNVIQDISNRLNGLVFGSPTNTLNTSTLLSNVITPHDTESNELKLQVYSKYNDITDSAENKRYTVPVSIKNIYNVPALYYPQVDVSKELEVGAFNIVGARSENQYSKNLINSINVSWYQTSGETVYPIISLPEQTSLDSLIDTSSNGINYNLLLTCVLDYLKTIDVPTLTDDQYNKLETSIINNFNITENTSFNNLIEQTVNNKITDISNNINQNKNYISTLIEDVNLIKIKIENISTGGNTSIDTSSIDGSINTLKSNISELSNYIDNSITKIDSSITKIDSSVKVIDNSISFIDSSIDKLWEAINNQQKTIKSLIDLVNANNEKLIKALKWQK